MTLLSLIASVLSLATTSLATTPPANLQSAEVRVLHATPQAAVEAYGASIFTADANAMAAAFQPSAMMYCTDGSDIRGTSQAQWKARLRTDPVPAPVSTEIVWLDAGPQTALARAIAVRGDRVFTDYILLARLGDGWRIVGKLCQSGSNLPVDAAPAIDAVVDEKLASDRSWDADRLAQSIDPRALVMTVENGEFVAATLAEWQGRYVDRRRTSPGNAVTVVSRHVEAAGDIGVATWTFLSPSGGTWTDRALVMRTPEGWRMMALLFVKNEEIAPVDPD